jgi:hypothetical protein
MAHLSLRCVRDYRTWEARVGRVGCQGDHEFKTVNLSAGMARLECVHCDMVVVDLDAAEDGLVTAPGLFGPAKPTIFSVLGEERRAEETAQQETPRRSGPRFAFGGASAGR